MTPEGGHLGTVRLPAGEGVLAVSPALVATSRRDENDAAVISLYRNPLPRGAGE